MPRICIVPRVDGSGGMASFRLKFEDGLHTRGVDVTYDPAHNPDALLLIAGTRNLLSLWKARRRGTRIVQRLDGINWVQRARWTGPRYHVRAEYGNALLAFIRARLADRVVYQSQFIRRWWEDWYGPAAVPARVILNGVDLHRYAPAGSSNLPADRFRLLVVEGSLAGGLDTGLRAAARLADLLSEKFPIELVVAGRVDARLQSDLGRRSRAPIRFLGFVPREQIPELDRSAHLLFSAEINPPCPNSVIEALACGLPVLGFDTGALAELVADDAGRLVPYGSDRWKLEPPDVPALVQPAIEILQDQPRFRRAARARAEAALGLDPMVDAYLKTLLEN
ncbi:MAG TPA: glycosyltransferase family 4 protein [Anaerolineales bacterium]|jgi:glycosyltransferase involved in cell wall biosynthesis